MSLRLPYIQVTAETWTKARSLAGMIDVPMAQAFMMLCDLWSWGLALGPRDEAPTGEFVGSYALGALAGAVGWTGDKAALRDALVQLELVEFTGDGLRVRGMDRYRRTWEKNVRRKPAEEVPVTGTKRAGSGAKPARKIEIEIDKKETEALVGQAPADLQAAWNELKAPEQPAWKEMPDPRAAHAKARLKERPLDEWREVISRLARSSFATGRRAGSDGRVWVAGPDYLLKPGSAAKVLEGAFDDRAGPIAPPKGAATAADKNWDNAPLPATPDEDLFSHG